MARAQPRPLLGLAILVIDDHRDTVDMFQQYLTASGAKVIGAGSAKSALGVVEDHVLDAAVVDLRMPHEDGWWFLRQLRGADAKIAQPASAAAPAAPIGAIPKSSRPR